jgi:bifunctional DNase/RNase
VRSIASCTASSPNAPLTHQLTFDAIRALGGHIEEVDVVDLKHNTFYAQIRLAGGPRARP